MGEVSNQIPTLCGDQTEQHSKFKQSYFFLKPVFFLQSLSLLLKYSYFSLRGRFTKE